MPAKENDGFGRNARIPDINSLQPDCLFPSELNNPGILSQTIIDRDIADIDISSVIETHCASIETGIQVIEPAVLDFDI